jgi:hypothetical protein
MIVLFDAYIIFFMEVDMFSFDEELQIIENLRNMSDVEMRCFIKTQLIGLTVCLALLLGYILLNK